MILALIPARAGSKEIPNKNLKKVGGIMLWQRSVNAAQSAKLLDKIAVSTDSDFIIEKCKAQKINFIKRPRRLATDHARMGDVVWHAFKKYRPEIIVLLQPTSPFRDGKLIDRCIRLFIKNKCDALATGFYARLCPYALNNKQRQQIKKRFYDDGNIYIFSKSTVLKRSKFGNKNTCCESSKKESIEIDSLNDLKFAQEIGRLENQK